MGSRYVPARRAFLRAAASTAGLALIGCGAAVTGPHGGESEGDEPEVSPAEDLMQEHGLIARVLLVYEATAEKLARNEAVDLAITGEAAQLVRTFVEQYHEQLEEQHVFPRTEAAGRERALSATLRAQHARGRELTADILQRVARDDHDGLTAPLSAFVRMYRPHAAREDTVLFRVFREVVGRDAYHELGERFEDEEHRRFGPHGFEAQLAAVARFEASLGIADLAGFTA